MFDVTAIQKIRKQNETCKHENQQTWGSGHPLWPPAATTQTKMRTHAGNMCKVPLKSEISTRGFS